ncbi:MAG: GNAT family N-acetyltransferase [Betaproteobacteria bacterium]|nr:MAG: GNAT family N-acetyltransferase [Betaproteobacteria bacterium]
MNALSIRRADSKDAPALASLFADAAMQHFTDVPPHTGVAYWEQRLADYTDASHLPLVAIKDGAVIGLALLQAFPNHIRRKHSASIRMLAVSTAHRRTGVGRALIEALIRACDDWLNVRRIEVAIDADSAALHRYYASFGFVAEGRKCKDILHAGQYVDVAVLSRMNEGNLPAPTAPKLLIAKRKKLRPIKIAVRPATSDDADAFASIFASRSASSGTLQHPYTSTDIWHTRLSSNTSTRQVVFAATVNGRVVGNAGVHPVSDNPRQRHVCGVGLGVTDAYQSRGVGRALMNACLDFADHWANYARVELTVHADNTRAIKLYESLGFVVEGQHRDFSFREGGYVDALFMGRLSRALATC